MESARLIGNLVLVIRDVENYLRNRLHLTNEELDEWDRLIADVDPEEEDKRLEDAVLSLAEARGGRVLVGLLRLKLEQRARGNRSEGGLEYRIGDWM